MSEPPRHEWQLACPVPLDDHATVQLAHGGGGRLMRNLIKVFFLRRLPPTPLSRLRQRGRGRRREMRSVRTPSP